MKKALNEIGKSILEMYMNCYNEAIPKSIRDIYRKKLLDKYSCMTVKNFLSKKTADRDGFKKYLLGVPSFVNSDLDFAYDVLLDWTRWIEDNNLMAIAEMDKKRQNIIITHMVGTKIKAILDSAKVDEAYFNPTPFTGNNWENIGMCCAFMETHRKVLAGMNGISNAFGVKIQLSEPYISTCKWANVDIHFIVPIQDEYNEDMMNWLQAALVKLAGV